MEKDLQFVECGKNVKKKKKEKQKSGDRRMIALIPIQSCINSYSRGMSS